LILLAAQKDEDAGENGDNSSNNAEVESKNRDQTVNNQENRQQKHSDIFCEGHEPSYAVIASEVEESRYKS
jgi:hypothetical protein